MLIKAQNIKICEVHLQQSFEGSLYLERPILEKKKSSSYKANKKSKLNPNKLKKEKNNKWELKDRKRQKSIKLS